MMDRWEAIFDFWSSFGWAVYEETSVPKDAVMPYITYEAAVGGFEDILTLSASLWTRNGSWALADEKADEIERSIKNMTVCPKINGGRYRVYTSGEFARSSGDPDDRLIKRKILTVNFEFMTE